MLFWVSTLAALACSREVSRSETSDSSFFFLLSDASFNFSSDLSQFKLSTEYLVFFLFQGAFSFFKSSLKFHFLGFQTFSDFVNFMDGFTSFADLVHDVLDFIAYFIKLQDGFFICRLDTEKFR